MRDLLHFHTASAEENNRAANAKFQDFLDAVNASFEHKPVIVPYANAKQITVTEEI